MFLNSLLTFLNVDLPNIPMPKASEWDSKPKHLAFVRWRNWEWVGDGEEELGVAGYSDVVTKYGQC